uniref:Uncharacterized protein n=1 Tax=Panagrolaimus superbus TaxID=310955 RepID=A0A914YZK2_9BILA
MPAILSKIRKWIYNIQILAYIKRSCPSSYDEKLQKLMKEKEDLVASWRNPSLPEILDDLPADAERRRQLCVQRAERCKQLYDDLAGFKNLYKETIEKAGVLLTYNEKIHLTKPYSLFDPTCTCCFLELTFHFPPLAPPTNKSKTIEENSETAPLLENEVTEFEETVEVDGIERQQAPEVADDDDDIVVEEQTEFFSPMSKTSNDTFQSCEPIDSDTEMHTVRSGSSSTVDKESDDAAEDGDSSDGTWNAEDADVSGSSLSTASEGSVHMGEDSSDDDIMVDKSEDDEYIGGDDVATDTKENDISVNKGISNSSGIHPPPSSSFRD